ncbi:PIN domain-containing protein [Povalibacter sp.]|uniref:PIN domain-containing protein n=1 Tax=Povalibacter sp. TaxID=1962978 RepID=UPI002F400107
MEELSIVLDPDLRRLTRAAAILYARCRWQSFTPRSANDCLVAACATRFELLLLHRDRDFERMAVLEPALTSLRLG